MASTIQFLRQFLRPRRDAVEAGDTAYVRDGERLPATLYRPAGRHGRLPAWVILHGLTYQGRHHRALDRFARAVAASGSLALVPEVPEWRRLQVAPTVTAASIAGAIAALQHLEGADADRIGVIGFSFGATQALSALTDPRLEGKVRGLAAWGGYCDLYNLFRFGFTGQHELDGVGRQIRPDPYGAWIMGANYLTHVPGHHDDGDVAAALLELASESGRLGLNAWDPAYDPLKARLRDRLNPAKRELLQLFAPMSDQVLRESDYAWYMTRALADAALAVDPMLDPQPFLPRVRVATVVAHGRDDRLVPYTESIRISRALSPDVCSGCTITSLFAHSGGAAHSLGPIGVAREAAKLGLLLNRILNLV